MPAEPRYRAVHPGDLRTAPLDVLTAVYDRRSGQTHLLASPLPEILAALGGGDCTLAALVATLAGQYELASEADDTQAAVIARLAELASLGLVERI